MAWVLLRIGSISCVNEGRRFVSERVRVHIDPSSSGWIALLLAAMAGSARERRRTGLLRERIGWLGRTDPRGPHRLGRLLPDRRHRRGRDRAERIDEKARGRLGQCTEIRSNAIRADGEGVDGSTKARAGTPSTTTRPPSMLFVMKKYPNGEVRSVDLAVNAIPAYAFGANGSNAKSSSTQSVLKELRDGSVRRKRDRRRTRSLPT